MSPMQMEFMNTVTFKYDAMVMESRPLINKAESPWFFMVQWPTGQITQHVIEAGGQPL